MTETPTPTPQAARPSAPPPAAPQSRPSNGVTIYRPAIIAGLYLLNIVLGFSVLVGLVLAYVWRSEKDTPEWEATHFTYLIRTFWISCVFGIGSVAIWIAGIFAVVAVDEAANGGATLGSEPAFVAAIFVIIGAWLLLVVWYCIRCILSLVKAAKAEPMPNPETWLF